MELAKAYFCQAAKLNPNNIRALYGLLLVSYKMILYTMLEQLQAAFCKYIISDNKQYCNVTKMSCIQEEGSNETK